MKQRYSLTSIRTGDGEIKHRYRGKINRGSPQTPAMMGVERDGGLDWVVEDHESSLNEYPEIIKVKTEFTESVSGKARLINWFGENGK